MLSNGSAGVLQMLQAIASRERLGMEAMCLLVGPTVLNFNQQWHGSTILVAYDSSGTGSNPLTSLKAPSRGIHCY